ncbi:MAG: hypothetical protein PCFJNLEI_01856 [Verrucomicrobiae bacterium]|nr:hypothetical protein [Verrucomicrobiae bacterium]
MRVFCKNSIRWPRFRVALTGWWSRRSTNVRMNWGAGLVMAGVALAVSGCSMAITSSGIVIGPSQRSREIAPLPPSAPAKMQPKVTPVKTSPGPKEPLPVARQPAPPQPAARLPSVPAIVVKPRVDPAPAAGHSLPFRAGPHLFVALNGNDAQAGTEELPFATVVRAQAAIQQLKLAGETNAITVVIRGGIHELAAPLNFGPADGGTDQQGVYYQAYPGERPIFSGGRQITGWQRTGAKVWETQLPPVSEGKWDFRQLFVNNMRAIRARFPNADPKFLRAGVLDITGADVSTNGWTIRVKPGSLPKWQQVKDSEVVTIALWEIIRKRLVTVETKSGTLVPAPPYLRGNPVIVPQRGQKLFLENAEEFLDQPGEWYLDRTAGLLKYLPRTGENLAVHQVVAPVLEQLLVVRGTAAAPVRNLHFIGLAFVQARWPLPEIGYLGRQAGRYWNGVKGIKWGWESPIAAALLWEYAHDCSFIDGIIRDLEGSAVCFGVGTKRCRLAGTALGWLGGNGVMVADGRDRPDQSDIVEDILIENNRIADCGLDYSGAVGIWVGMARQVTVRHNFLERLPYSGISVGWRWESNPSVVRQNVIESNHLRDIMQLLTDGGGIYVLGAQPDSIMRANLLDRIRGRGAIYLDQGTAGYLIESNLVRGASKAVNINMSRRADQTWGHNFFTGPRPAPGKVGQGLLVNREVQSFVRGDYRKTSETDAFTLMAWVKPSKFTSRSYIFSKGSEGKVDEFGLLLQQAKLIGRLNIGGGTNFYAVASADTAISANTWQHVALAHGQQHLRLFLNGVQVADKLVNQPRVPTDAPIAIGSHSAGAAGMFDGVIDEVRLYHRELSPAEVAAHHQGLGQEPEDGADPTLVNFWDFEDLTDPAPEMAKIVNQAGLKEPYRTQFKE